jgi:hypothetical protein
VPLGRPPAPLGDTELYTFVARFSPAGDCLWSRRAPGHDVAVDAAGRIHLTDGSVYAPDGSTVRASTSERQFGGIDVDVFADGSQVHIGRGSGLDGMTVLGQVLVQDPSEMVFVLDPDGSPRWVREMPAPGGLDVTMFLVDAGPAGEVRVHGRMGPGVTLDFGGGVAVTATASQEGFVVEYASDGTPVRAFLVGGGSMDPFGRRAAFAPTDRW